MMDALEGYADGLAGIGRQHRFDGVPHGHRDHIHAVHYRRGFDLGSLDRKTMLHRQQRQALADFCVAEWLRGKVWTEEELRDMGLVSQPQDTQEGYADGISGHPKQDRRCGEYREWRDYENGYALGSDDAAVMEGNRAFAAWADGMGDGNG